MLEGDGASHRVADEPNGWMLQMLEQGFEVFGQGAHTRLLWVVRVSVPAKVERDYVKAFGDHWGDMVPPVGVGATAVQ